MILSMAASLPTTTLDSISDLGALIGNWTRAILAFSILVGATMLPWIGRWVS